MSLQSSRLSVDAREFYGYGGTVLATGLLNIGFGAIDISMLTPFGASTVAGVGLSNILLAAMLALSYGFLDQLAADVARARAAGRLGRASGTLWRSAVSFTLLWGGVLYLLSLTLPACLTWLNQPSLVVDSARNYLSIRAPFISVGILHLALSSALRICGQKGFSLLALAAGFAANALLNWLFLYTHPFSQIWRPETAVAWSTVIAQCVMIVLSLTACIGYVRTLQSVADTAAGGAIARMIVHLRDYAKATWTVGVKHLNDYAGSFILMILIGQTGTKNQAAAQIAATIMTVFYRLPQALCDATLVHYSDAAERCADGQDRRVTEKKLFRLAFWPTISAGVIAACTMSWIVSAATLGSSDISKPIAVTLARIDLAFLPFYAIQHIYAQFLIVEKKRTYLMTWSMMATYLLFLPVAIVCRLLIGSPQSLYVIRGCSLALIAYAFYRPTKVPRPDRASSVNSSETPAA